MTGRLIALEGIDGAGKTTQSRLLAQALGAEATFQFGATGVGRVIRQVLLDPAHGKLDDRAEALLVVADKAQHVFEVVEPALKEGRDVVTDRYTASTLAYQGYGRGLDRAELQRMLDFATGGLEPHLTVLLDIDPAMCHGRLEPSIDRFASAAAVGSFVERVRRGYLELAEADPSRWAVVDAAGSVEQVADRVLRAVQARFSCADQPC